MSSSELHPSTLFVALDRRRRDRDLNWRQVVEEINGLFAETGARPISTSTVTGLRGRPSAEADGVLQMLRWLGRTPESLLREEGGATPPFEALSPAGRDRILRFDTAALFAAVSAMREEEGGISWPAVARDVGGITAASLKRLAGGGRTHFPTVMRVTGWLGMPVAHFVRPRPA